MAVDLWKENHPRKFWQCQPDVSDEVWQTAIARALPGLDLYSDSLDAETALNLTLGEGRFGPDHWQLSFAKRAYYLLKPVLPRAFTRILRRAYQGFGQPETALGWPIEARYVSFVWNVLAEVLKQIPGEQLFIRPLWPNGQRFAFVLTHDVETKSGMAFVRQVADLEESLGFWSSFNFVPGDYEVDPVLVSELRQRGFEVGLHGLKHDGKLFDSRSGFERKAAKINSYLKAFRAVGFRSPLTMRNPEWMQSLDIEYDSSFFDTDPFEPIPGGTMSIWPFWLGHFIELPYTLVQDYTLTDVLREDSPRLWLEKVDFIEAHCGMALLNSHPDYLRAPFRWDIYSRFLNSMREQGGYWHALPRDVSRWWRGRWCSEDLSTMSLDEGAICITSQARLSGPAPYSVPL